ncbi:alpha/beta fold hydrolase [Mucilaginibacter sp. UR6-11]|uniref:alpha/beta fold hydrolase n=1 Tax=Mucilaginibacter sp. UR6-11 TaxID=1435644 RepID=UPI001E30B8C4|nr:alpha/beta hydrolase [Mucilaginibacter sp. UR6-11]MCC8425691.1 alpha/beta hydrolase [Mucilaginibacter sp. UR6-11]
MNNHKTTIGQHAAINGISMYYEIHGEGNMPLVLIHGGGSTINTTFGRILSLLSAHGKVIALELQAHGRTTDRNAPETFEQDADDVAALLKHLHIEKANILGFSNGGTTTLQLAIRHPQLVNKIIVIAGAYKRDGFLPGFFEGMQQVTINHMPAILKEEFLKLTPDETRLQAMFEKDKARMISFKDYSDETLKSIKAASLFIVSDKDVITVEHTQQMSLLTEGGQLAVLPGVHGGFLGAMESDLPADSKMPELTAMLIREFLEQ